MTQEKWLALTTDNFGLYSSLEPLGPLGTKLIRDNLEPRLDDGHFPSPKDEQHFDQWKGAQDTFPCDESKKNDRIDYDDDDTNTGCIDGEGLFDTTEEPSALISANPPRRRDDGNNDGRSKGKNDPMEFVEGQLSIDTDPEHGDGMFDFATMEQEIQSLRVLEAELLALETASSRPPVDMIVA